LIFAGFETSGNSMALLFSNLIVRPKEIALLREEISANSPIDSSVSAAKLVRLNACFNESMRLWPPTVVNLFDVERRGSILGTQVKPGDQVLISHYACSRDPEVFPAPEEFRPERFLISPESLRDNPDAVKDVPQVIFFFFFFFLLTEMTDGLLVRTAPVSGEKFGVSGSATGECENSRTV
jgi:hypothetical protein